MSSLPKRVREPHFAAQRNYNRHGKVKDKDKFRSELQELTAVKQIDANLFNGMAEKLFVKWLLYRLCGLPDGLSTAWVRKNGAYFLDLSTETIKRYLWKHTADEAEFCDDGKTVTTNPVFSSCPSQPGRS